MRVQFYECDADFPVLGGRTVSIFPEVAIAVSAQHRMEDGATCYRPPKDVVLAEWADGAVGPECFRFTLRVR